MDSKILRIGDPHYTPGTKSECSACHKVTDLLANGECQACLESQIVVDHKPDLIVPRDTSMALNDHVVMDQSMKEFHEEIEQLNQTLEQILDYQDPEQTKPFHEMMKKIMEDRPYLTEAPFIFNQGALPERLCTISTSYILDLSGESLFPVDTINSVDTVD